MCKVIVLSLWTMSFMLTALGTRGGIGRTIGLVKSNSVASVQCDWLPSPGGYAVLRSSRSVSVLSSSRALVCTPVLLRWVSVFPGKTLFSEATEPLCVADVR